MICHRLHICASMFCLDDLFSGDISKMKLYQTIRCRIHICDHPDHLFQDEIAWYVEGVASWMQKHDCNVHSDVLFLFHGQILRVMLIDICLKILPGNIDICDLNEVIWCVWWGEGSNQKPYYKIHICSFVDEEFEYDVWGRNFWHKIHGNTDKCVSGLSNEHLLPEKELEYEKVKTW